MRIPITSQLAALVLVMAAWSAWTGPAERVGRDQAVVVRPAAPETWEIVVQNAHLDGGRTWINVCDRQLLFLGDRLEGAVSDLTPDCMVQALRSDGHYTARSQAVAFTGQPVTLVLPAYRVGGIGVEIVERNGRVYVGGVMRDGSAREVGIAEGDQLLDAEGLPFTSAREMQEKVLGPDLTFVNVGVIRRTGETIQSRMFTLQRRSDVE